MNLKRPNLYKYRTMELSETFFVLRSQMLLHAAELEYSRASRPGESLLRQELNQLDTESFTCRFSSSYLSASETQFPQLDGSAV